MHDKIYYITQSERGFLTSQTGFINECRDAFNTYIRNRHKSYGWPDTHSTNHRHVTCSCTIQSIS